MLKHRLVSMKQTVVLLVLSCSGGSFYEYLNEKCYAMKGPAGLPCSEFCVQSGFFCLLCSTIFAVPRS